MLFNLGKVVVTKEQIAAKVRELGAKITEDFKGKDLVVIGVLKGGFIFLADLVREIRLKFSIDFIAVSSYGSGMSSSGAVKILKDIDMVIEGKHVLLVEDLIDTGLTLNYLKALLATRKPADIKTCTILDKPAKRRANIMPDYKGIEIPDVFVVGYGLDYAGKCRNLPEVYSINTTLTQIKR